MSIRQPRHASKKDHTPTHPRGAMAVVTMGGRAEKDGDGSHEEALPPTTSSPHHTVAAASTTGTTATGRCEDHPLLMISLSRFYVNGPDAPKNIGVLRSFVDGTSPFSLRLLDWFVTNYCRNRKVIVDVQKSHTDVFTSYRSQLKAFSKHMFDPFRRSQRIDFYYDDDHYIQTTIGQLNFFRWTIESGIIDFVSNRKHDMESQMMSRLSAVKKQHEHQRGRASVTKPASAVVDIGAADGGAPPSLESATGCGNNNSDDSLVSVMDGHATHIRKATSSPTTSTASRAVRNYNDCHHHPKSRPSSATTSVQHFVGDLVIQFN